MAQVIKIKRGTEAARVGLSVALGEIIYTTDDNRVFFGTGAADGGTEIGYLRTDAGGTIGGDVAINGNLTVTGDVTQTSTQNVNIGDAIITLAADNIDNPIDDAGIEVYRGTTDKKASIIWDESANEWTMSTPDDINTAPTFYRILDETDILTAGTGIDITTGTISNSDLGSSQLFYRTVTGNSGTTSASTNEDSLSIVGAGSVTTAVTGDTVTITGTNTTYTADETSLNLVGTEFRHATGSGHYHITDNGTNNGDVLTATGTPGVFSWESAGAATNNSTITVEGDGAALLTGSETFTTNQASDSTVTVTHSTADGYKHVPATGTGNNNKVLTAGATAGSFSWVTPTDLSTDVTLASVANNYLTIAGQEITAGIVPVTLGGTGATTASGARTNLGVDVAGTDNSPTLTKTGVGGGFITPQGTKGHELSIALINIDNDTGMASSDSSLAISGNDVTVDTIDGGTFT